jgi:hypothetical protein
MSQAARSYTMNPDGAKAAGESNRIDTTGAYVGAFSRAEAVTSKQKTEGVEFTFVDVVGREASFLSLWTFKDDGTELSGKKMLDAMMTCMKLRGIEPSQATVEKWVNGAKGNHVATVFKALMGPKIGLLLAVEPYEKDDGSIGQQLVIEGVFEADGKRTARNVLDRVPDDGTLQKMIDRLRDRKVRPRQQSRNTQTHGQRQAANRSTVPFDDMADDDIPF